MSMLPTARHPPVPVPSTSVSVRDKDAGEMVGVTLDEGQNRAASSGAGHDSGVTLSPRVESKSVGTFVTSRGMVRPAGMA